MPSTVIVNNMTVVHGGSGGISQIFPDVCKTPAPTGPPIPLPYPNIAMSSDTADGSSTVSCDGKPVMIKSSNFKMSTGDEAGSAMGLVSSKTKGKAEPKLFSMDVKFDGENVMRLSDIMLQNIGGSPNTPPGTEVQAPAVAMGADAKPKDPEKPEVTDMKWDKKKIVCGDQTKLDVKTKNFQPGDKLPVNVMRKQGGVPSHDAFSVDVNGDQGTFEWTSRQCKWAKEIDVAAAQNLFKGKQKSNDVKMRTVPEVALVKQKITTNAVPPFGWDAGFEAEIRKGVFRVVRKIHFKAGTYNPGGPPAQPGRRLKRTWKREIEAIWDRKWKLHRKQCKRGDTCDCYGDNGCCMFIIHIVAVWEAGPFLPVGFNRGPNAINGLEKKINWGGVEFPNPHYRWWWFSHDWWEGRQGLGNAAAVVAHEFGHLLGLYDEYTGGANLVHKRTGRLLYANMPGSIMNAGTRTEVRHFLEFKKWFDSKAKSVLGKTKLVRM